MVGNPALLKGLTEELRNIVLNAHSSEHDSEFLLGIIAQRRLLYNLCRKLIVRQTISGKDRKLLAANQRRQAIDC